MTKVVLNTAQIIDNLTKQNKALITHIDRREKYRCFDGEVCNVIIENKTLTFRVVKQTFVFKFDDNGIIAEITGPEYNYLPILKHCVKELFEKYKTESLVINKDEVEFVEEPISEQTVESETQN